MLRGYRGLLIVITIMSLLFSGFAYTLHHPRFHRFLLRIVEKKTGWKISFDDSKIKIFSASLSLERFRVQGPNGKFDLTGDHFLLDLSSFSMIRGKIVVSEMSLVHPVLITEKKESRTEIDWSKLNDFVEKFESSFFFENVILDNININDLVFFQIPKDNPQEAKKLDIQKISFSSKPSFFGHLTLSGEVRGVSGLSMIDLFQIKLSLEKNRILLENCELKNEKVHLKAHADIKGKINTSEISLNTSLDIPHVLADTLTVSLAGKLNNTLLTIDELKANLLKAELKGHGSFDLATKKYSLPFNARDLSLDWIFGKLPSVVLGPSKGLATVDGEAKGTLPELFAEAKATIRDLKHKVISAREVEGTIKLDWPELSFNANVRPGADRRIQATAKGTVYFLHIPTRKKLQAGLKTLDVKFENTTLQDILPTLEVTGQGQGDIHLEGTPDLFIKGTGHARINQGHWFLGDVSNASSEVIFKPGGEIVFTKTKMEFPQLPALDWPGEVSIWSVDNTINNPDEANHEESDRIAYRGKPYTGLTFDGDYSKNSEIFRINHLDFQNAKNNLSGNATFRSRNSMEGKIRGTMNLEWLSYFPAYFREAHGSIKTDLAFSGAIHEPLLRGTIDFLGNDLTLRSFSQEISNLKGSLTFNESSVKPNLTGTLGDGAFQLQGESTLSHWKAAHINLSFKGENLTYLKPNNYRLDFNTRIQMNGNWPSPKVSGRIDIVDGHYLRPFVIRDLILSPFEETYSGPEDTTFSNIALDLTIKNSGDIKINNNVATLFLQSDLQVLGTYGKPEITGALNLTEGTIHYLGQDFTLNEGRLEYIDPYHKDPYITLSAQQDIPPNQPTYTVFIDLKGYLSNLEVTLSSTPALPREDILSLIAFGLTQDEIKNSNLSSRTLTSGILGGEISSILEKPLSKTTKLDVFRLEASETGNLSRLSIGKNITDRLAVEFMNDLDPQTAERSIQGTYSLTDNVVLKGFRTWTDGTTPHYQFNISIRFRMN